MCDQDPGPRRCARNMEYGKSRTHKRINQGLIAVSSKPRPEAYQVCIGLVGRAKALGRRRALPTMMSEMREKSRSAAVTSPFGLPRCIRDTPV